MGVFSSKHTTTCPSCKEINVVPRWIEKGTSQQTQVYYPPRWNSFGVNLNPDRNIRTTHYKCSNGHCFKVKSSYDGDEIEKE